ncbi:MAG: hypothetical protein J5501_02600 [Ruminococcus sp.]|nr:hypothetical protein [Ruminococcus sp.]
MALRSEGKYLVYRESSGLVVNVAVYAFCKGDRYFFIDDDNSWRADYEMEQIANSVA